MKRRGYILATLATVFVASPAISQDKPAAATSPAMSAPANAVPAAAAPSGEVKREDARPNERQSGREEGRSRMGGDMRGEGDRDGIRGEGRGDRREMRSGLRVELGEVRRGERRWHHRHERIVVVHRHPRHHHEM